MWETKIQHGFFFYFVPFRCDGIYLERWDGGINNNTYDDGEQENEPCTRGRPVQTKPTHNTNKLPHTRTIFDYTLQQLDILS